MISYGEVEIGWARHRLAVPVSGSSELVDEFARSVVRSLRFEPVYYRYASSMYIHPLGFAIDEGVLGVFLVGDLGTVGGLVCQGMPDPIDSILRYEALQHAVVLGEAELITRPIAAEVQIEADGRACDSSRTLVRGAAKAELRCLRRGNGQTTCSIQGLEGASAST